MRTIVGTIVMVSTVVVVSVGAQGTPPPTFSEGDNPQEIVVTDLQPKFALLSSRTGNLLVYMGAQSSLTVGVQSPQLVGAAVKLVNERNARPITHAVVLEDKEAPARADGGAGRLGAITVTHENLYSRMLVARGRKDSAKPSEDVALPSMSFSEVLRLHLGDEEAHIVHHPAGYSDADAIVHFEKSGLLYLGNILTTDGYPTIAVDRRGSVSGLIKSVEMFLNRFGRSPKNIHPIIPARGSLATMTDLRTYRDMLADVRERVRQLIERGYNVDEVVKERPTAAHDDTWGWGPEPPDAFVRAVYRSVWEEKNR